MAVDKSELIKQYEERIRKELHGIREYSSFEHKAPESYLEFKNSLLPKRLSLYEKLCSLSEKLVKIAPPKSSRENLEEAIKTCHLDISPEGAQSFAFLFPIVFMIIGGIIGFIIPNFRYLFISREGSPIFFFVFLIFISVLILMLVFTKLPSQFSKKWRLSASNQMILSIFYMVTYLRHTSKLENAIRFSSEHLTGPLAFDFKRIIWQVENQKYESLSEALDIYLIQWQKLNPEFVEAIHLIESSLLETTEARRLQVLDKSLSVILEQTEEKMLHYAQNLKGPVNMLNMLGIIMPILGLVVMPLMVSIMGEDIKWFHIATIYNVIIPIAVFYIGRNILLTRPTGYGESDISEYNPELRKKKKIEIKLWKTFYISPLYLSLAVFLVLFIIGISPLLAASAIDVPEGSDIFPDLCFERSLSLFNPIKKESKSIACFLEYRKVGEEFVGPFGLGATLLSLFVVISFGIGIGYYFKKKSQGVITIRDNAKKLEDEFASALFQLGNRMSDGIPVEMAFPRVAASLEGTPSGSFFSLVSYNISRLGKNLEEAIFDPQTGAVKHVPSNVIASSMKVLVESSRKGPRIAAQAMMNVAEYIKQIHRVNERIKDLLSETITSMKSQIVGLAPGIAAVIVGITAMITYILGKLNLGGSDSEISGVGGLSQIFTGGAIPTYYFQIIVGIYIVQIIYILTLLVNSIENGEDKLNQDFLEGKNMIRSSLVYAFIAFVVITIFNILAGIILQRAF